MKNRIPYLIILSLAAALLVAIQRCSSERARGDAGAGILMDTVGYFQNRMGTQTATITTLQMGRDQLRRVILEKDKEIKALAGEFARVRSVTKIEAVTVFDTIRIPYRDTVPCVFERSGRITSGWYSLAYTSDQKGLTIDSLRSWTSATIVTGVKRKWLLGRETVTTDITFGNPHIKVKALQAAEVAAPGPWYKKWYLWLAAGIAGGLIVAR